MFKMFFPDLDTTVNSPFHIYQQCCQYNLKVIAYKFKWSHGTSDQKSLYQFAIQLGTFLIRLLATLQTYMFYWFI
jgi:hypothetical protein